MCIQNKDKGNEVNPSEVEDDEEKIAIPNNHYVHRFINKKRNKERSFIFIFFFKPKGSAVPRYFDNAE